MTDTTNTADDSNTPDEQTDEDLDDSIRDAGGTTSTQTRVWWGKDLYAGAFVLTACVLTLTYALLPAVGVEPVDPPLWTIAILGIGVFASLAWAFGSEALTAAAEAWQSSGSGGSED
jgi:hypothetical protein